MSDSQTARLASDTSDADFLVVKGQIAKTDNRLGVHLVHGLMELQISNVHTCTRVDCRLEVEVFIFRSNG